MQDENFPLACFKTRNDNIFNAEGYWLQSYHVQIWTFFPSLKHFRVPFTKFVPEINKNSKLLEMLFIREIDGLRLVRSLRAAK